MTSGNPGDKDGAARWAACPACGTWVHVGAALLDAGDIPLYCPSCQHRFPPADAADSV